MKRVLVPIAHGTEEMEAITIIDILRRAGIAVRVSKVIGSDPDESLACKMSRNVIVEAESKIQSEHDEVFDCICLPGGLQGAKTFVKSQTLTHMLQRQAHEGRLIGAICACPALVLHPLGLLKGVEEVTGYPSI